MLISCNTTQFLTEGQILLTKNTIKISKDLPSKERRGLKTELLPVIKQKPNTTFLGMGRVGLWMYFKHSKASDTTAWDKWVIKKLSQEPVFFDPSLNEASSSALRLYVQKKGYFQASVTYQENVNDQTGQATYFINPEKLYRIGHVDMVSEDKKIDSLLQAYKANTYLKAGEPANQKLYNLEKIRIVRIMQQHAYAKFNQAFIAPLQADTIKGIANILLEVLPQNNGLPHQQYRIGKIQVYPDYQATINVLPEIDTMIGGYRFINYGLRFKVKPKVIIRNIKLRPEEPFNVDNYDLTLRRLGRLGYYKFQYIKELPADDSTKINYNIYLSPEKKHAWGYAININNSNISASKQNYLGFNAPINYQNRNLFKGAESLNSSIIGGIEFSTRAPYEIRSVQFKVTNELSIPAYVNATGVYKGLSKLRILNPRIYKYLEDNASTKVNLSYEFFNINKYYRYHSINTSLGYDVFADNNRTHYRFNSIGFNYLVPFIQDTFNSILENNPVLERSFRRQLFSGILLRDFLYEHNSGIKSNGESFYTIVNFDLSGLEWMAVNYAANQFRDTFRIGSTEAAQYVKPEWSGSYLKDYGNKTALMLRANVGLAVPFGTSTAVPYVKQFYAGGPNSMRAWRIRQLGPGSYIDSISSKPEFDLPYYQTGDFKFEINAEYRFDIFWRLKGALFVDAGNVWALNTKIKESRPGAVLTSKSYKEIAVGSGFGLRLDFTFFIIRFDIGTKVRNPYPIEGKTKNPYYPYTSFGSAWKDLNLNLAIGLPFTGR
ncbi:MAG: BamA/TamA family outer membrane protein [Saprospiraceae bacterium]